MKNSSVSLFFASILTIILAVSLMLPSLTSAMSKSTAPKQPFEETAGWKKIDIRARQSYQEFKKTGKDIAIDAIIKTKEKPSASQKDELKSSGFIARTFIGRIITGSINLSALPQMTNLEFVEVIEMSVPMSLKKTEQTPLK